MTTPARRTQPKWRSTAVPASTRRTHHHVRSTAMPGARRHVHAAPRSDAMPATVPSVHATPRSTAMTAPARTCTRVCIRERPMHPAARAASWLGSPARSRLPAQLQAHCACIGVAALWGQIADEQGPCGRLRSGGISIDTNTSRWGCRRAA